MEILLAVILIVVAWAYISPKWQKAKRKAERQIRAQNQDKCQNNSRLTPENFHDYQIANEIRICRESAKIIAESKSIEVILGRIETLHQSASRLRDLIGPRRLAQSPELSELAAMSNETRIDLTRQAIEHTLDTTVRDALSLKTERGQRNRICAYFKQLEDLSESIPVELYPWISDKAAEYGTTFSALILTSISEPID